MKTSLPLASCSATSQFFPWPSFWKLYCFHCLTGAKGTFLKKKKLTFQAEVPGKLQGPLKKTCRVCTLICVTSKIFDSFIHKPPNKLQLEGCDVSRKNGLTFLFHIFDLPLFQNNYYGNLNCLILSYFNTVI